MNEKTPKTSFTQIIVSSLFIQALPELLTTQRDLNSSSSDLDFLLAPRKTADDFNLVPSALAAKHMRCHTVFRASCLQTKWFRSLLIDCSVRHHVIPDECFVHRYYTWRWICRICRINLSINCSGCFMTWRKIISTHEIVEPPIARYKKRLLSFIAYTIVKIFCLVHDKFLRDTQVIGSPVINPFS